MYRRPARGTSEEDAVGNDVVLRETSDGVATLTLNRPERRNGWSPELEAAYFAALDACDADDDVRAVVLTPPGSTFCPGLDTPRLPAVSPRAPAASRSPPPAAPPAGAPPPRPAPAHPKKAADRRDHRRVRRDPPDPG